MKFKLFPHSSAPKETPAATDGLVPAVRCSICTGEQVAGFKDPATGRFTEVMPIRCDRDLDQFKRKYKLTGEITKIY